MTNWLNYHHLYYFWVVCKEGGFSKAAEKLRISQSAVSLQISKLEEHLGEKLMARGPRGFKLTEAGQITWAHAEEIFRQGNDLIQYFNSGKMKSNFRVGTLGGLSKNLQFKILSKILSHDELELSLEVGDAPILIDRLANYKLDALLSDVPISSSETEPLSQTEIFAESYCLVARKKRKKDSTEDLNLYLKGGVYLPARDNPTTSAIVDFLAAKSPSAAIRGYIDDIAFLRLLALETDSVIAIPRIGVKRDLESGDLHILHEFNKIKQRYYLVYRQKGKRHPLLQELLKAT